LQLLLFSPTTMPPKRIADDGNDTAMDEETRAWYDAHRQEILRPPSTTSASTSTTSTPAADDASPPKAQEGTADEPVVV
jgi:hypothetical protein